MGKGNHGHSHEKNSGDHAHAHAHSHGHSHGGPKFCKCSDVLRLSCMLAMTFSFMLVELIVGQITKSISLTTDSFHMLSDVLALIIGLFTVIISKRKTTKNTFGWVRAEVLGPLVNSVFLISLCFGIVVEAIKRLFDLENIEKADLMLYTGLLGLLINVVGLFIFGHNHSHNIEPTQESDDEEDELKESEEIMPSPPEVSFEKESHVYKPNKEGHSLVNALQNNTKIVIKDDKETKKAKKTACCSIMSSEANMNMKAVFLHVLADALGSVIVVASALLNKFQEPLKLPETFVKLIDPVLSLCLVALILASTVPLLKESALILLQTVPKEIEVKQLKEDLVKISGITAVHELHIWRLSGKKIIATAHVICHNSEEYMQIAEKIKAFFHEKGIHSTTIQPEFTDSAAVMSDNCALECKKYCNENTCCGQTNVAQPTCDSKSACEAQKASNNNNNSSNNNNNQTSNVEASSSADINEVKITLDA